MSDPHLHLAIDSYRHRHQGAQRPLAGTGIRPGNLTNLAAAQAIGAEANAAQAARFAAKVRPVIDAIYKSGISSLHGIAAVLNARGMHYGLCDTVVAKEG